MDQNVGHLDRTVRAITGLEFLGFAWGLYFPDTDWNWLGWVGILPLASAFWGRCLLYHMMGYSTIEAPTDERMLVRFRMQGD